MSIQKSPFTKLFLPIIFIFIFVSSLAIIFKDSFQKFNIDTDVLIMGNVLLFLVTTVSFFLYRKALFANNTHAFLRNVYGGMMLKLFVCIFAAFIYIYASGGRVNKGALFSVMFLYFIYTFVEVAILMKQSKQSKNV